MRQRRTHIAQRWDEWARVALTPSTPLIERWLARRAFYAGIQQATEMIWESGSPTETMGELTRELDEFNQNVKQGRA